MTIIQQFYKKSNLYFFGEESIHPSDFVWFYGFMSFFLVVGLFVATINVINL